MFEDLADRTNNGSIKKILLLAAFDPKAQLEGIQSSRSVNIETFSHVNVAYQGMHEF